MATEHRKADQTPEVVSVETKIVPKPGSPILYTNSAKISMSGWDLRIQFATAATVDDDTEIAHEIVTVIMSPTHAKVMLKILQNSLERYEKTFGPIPDITAIVDELRARQQQKAISEEDHGKKPSPAKRPRKRSAN